MNEKTVSVRGEAQGKYNQGHISTEASVLMSYLQSFASHFRRTPGRYKRRGVLGAVLAACQSLFAQSRGSPCRRRPVTRTAHQT